MIKSPAEIALMREAGRVVANTLARVREAAAVGVSLKELDELAAATDCRRRGHAGLPELQAAVGLSAVSRGDLHVGQRRRGARHPQRLPAPGR